MVAKLRSHSPIRAALAALVTVLALPATAASITQMGCGFTNECYEAGGCSESDLSFVLNVIANADAPPPATDRPPNPALGEIRQGEETLIGEVVRMDTGALIYRSNFRIVNNRIRVAPPALLTVVPNGEARYTVHLMDVALSITYRGRCAIVEPEAEKEEKSE